MALNREENGVPFERVAFDKSIAGHELSWEGRLSRPTRRYEGSFRRMWQFPLDSSNTWEEDSGTKCSTKWPHLASMCATLQEWGCVQWLRTRIIPPKPAGFKPWLCCVLIAGQITSLLGDSVSLHETRRNSESIQPKGYCKNPVWDCLALVPIFDECYLLLEWDNVQLLPLEWDDIQ